MRGLLQAGRHRMEEASEQAAGVLAELAADQVEGLDAVGALVDLGDAGVADILLDAGLADVAVAAEHLHGEVRGGEAVVGEEGLDDRGHQRREIVGRLPLGRIGVAFRTVELEADPVGERPGAFREGLDGQQVPAHVRVDDDRVGRAIGRTRAGRRAALEPLQGVGPGLLVGGLGGGQTLHARRRGGRRSSW